MFIHYWLITFEYGKYKLVCLELGVSVFVCALEEKAKGGVVVG